MLVSQIAKDVGRANNRKDYASVCARIKIFAESGYPAKANDLIADLKVEQKRRSAFVLQPPESPDSLRQPHIFLIVQKMKPPRSKLRGIKAADLL